MTIHITDKFLVTYVVNNTKFVTEEIEIDQEYLPKSRYDGAGYYRITEAWFTKILIDIIRDKVRNGSYGTYDIAIINWWEDYESS